MGLSTIDEQRGHAIRRDTRCFGRYSRLQVIATHRRAESIHDTQTAEQSGKADPQTEAEKVDRRNKRSTTR